jgi:hypothetical protein
MNGTFIATFSHYEGEGTPPYACYWGFDYPESICSGGTAQGQLRVQPTTPGNGPWKLRYSVSIYDPTPPVFLAAWSKTYTSIPDCFDISSVSLDIEAGADPTSRCDTWPSTVTVSAI